MTEVENAAVSLMLTGGNHLANYLIGKRGGSFSREFPPGTEPAKVRAAMTNYDYDVWCCWDAMMRARDSLGRE